MDQLDHIVLACVEAKLFASAPPKMVGRYEILGQIGTGGMGAVFAAYDPQLDRRVAVKLVHADKKRGGKLLAEAQALAEVAHENVVEVFDVGMDGDELFIGMELVEGHDLEAWLAEEPRDWRAVLAVFLAAGQGLNAAHARGVVHRDFKPANVLIGKDGRVRVADFGLAAAVQEHEGEEETARETLDRTVTGPVAAGTPAFMAPEQHRGAATDPRTDQFAFCVSLYEALYGERPFRGESMADLERAKLVGLPKPPPGSGVPRWILSVLRKGTAPTPGQRYRDMPALLRGLRRRRSLPPWAAAGIGLAAAAGVAWVATARERCDGERGFGKVWNAERSAALERAVTGTEASYAEETALLLRTRLDAYAARWIEAASAVCRDRSDDAVEPLVLDVRQGCLDRRREEVRVTLEVLEHADSVERAVMTVADLPEPSTCSNLGADDRPVVSPEDAVLADALRLRLARATALAGVGDGDEGRDEARDVRADAKRAELADVVLEATLALGRIEQLRGNAKVAAEHLSAAALEATAGRHDAVAAEAAIAMIQIAGGWQASFEAAEDWNRHAVAALERMGTPPTLEANRLYSMGILSVMRSDPDLGQPQFERALALHRETLDEHHPRIVADLAGLADAKLRAGDDAGGLEYAELAHKSAQQAFGERHPKTATVRITLGHTLFRAAEYEQAALYFERARADLEASVGPESPILVPAYTGLGASLQRAGDLDAALAAFERADEVGAAVAGHPNVAVTANLLAEIRIERGEYEAALAQAERSVATREKIFGADHPELAIALLTEAKALVGLGRGEEAWRKVERVERVVADQPLPGPKKVYRLSVTGQALLALGRDDEAAQRLEAARREQEAIGAAKYDRAEVDFHYARALARTGERAKAVALAKAARDAFGDDAPQQVARVDAWLAR